MIKIDPPRPAPWISLKAFAVALSEIDRDLLQRCLARTPRAWEQFVDRFLGLVVHVIQHSGQARSIRLSGPDVDDLAAEVFLALVRDDFSVLRKFRGESSLATYLTVIARRVVIRELLRRKGTSGLLSAIEDVTKVVTHDSDAEQRINDREEVERMISRLDGPEREVVRLYHLEGKSYREISSRTGISENSVGPTLSRAREKMRRNGR